MPMQEAIALRENRVAQLTTQLAHLPLAGRPLTLEVGCGHGHFLTAYAARHPDEYCVAVDLLRDRLERAARKSNRAGLTNVAWLQAEATDLLAAWPAGVRITRNVFVLFPDPWPKRRHWKHRLIQAGFLTDLARICAPGATLCFRTDHGPYFGAAETELHQHPDWQPAPTAPWPFEQTTVFESRAPAYHSCIATRR